MTNFEDSGLDSKYLVFIHYNALYLSRSFDRIRHLILIGKVGFFLWKQSRYNDIIFDKSMPHKIEQEKFLANVTNKSCLIDMLRKILSENIVVVSEDVEYFIEGALPKRSRNLFPKTRQRQNNK